MNNRWQIGFFMLLVVLIIGATVVSISSSDREADVVAAREDTEELEEEIDDLEDELTETRAELRRVRGKYEATKEEVVTAEEAEAFATEGLSADGTDFSCIDFQCLEIKARVQFFNDSDQGSPVTCVFEVTHLNGRITHTTFGSPYVPAQGEDNQVWYYYSPLRGTEIDTYDIGECHRGEDDESGDE